MAGATYQNGLSGASVWVALRVASVNLVFEPSAAMRSMSATTSVRACTASVVDDSTRKSARTEVAPRRELDDPRHHPPPQDVVGQVRPVALDADLYPVGRLGQVQQTGRRVQEADGLLGAALRAGR